MIKIKEFFYYTFNEFNDDDDVFMNLTSSFVKKFDNYFIKYLKNQLYLDVPKRRNRKRRDWNTERRNDGKNPFFF